MSLRSMLIDSARRQRQELVGVTTSHPALVKSSPSYAVDAGGQATGAIVSGSTYVVDVRIEDVEEEIRGVPIAHAAQDLYYAAPGAAVSLWRFPETGRLEVSGWSKHKPGRFVIVTVADDVVTATEDRTIWSRPIRWDEFDDFGGWGVCPWGGVAVYRGWTLIEVRGA